MAIGQGCTSKGGALATCLSFPTTRSSTRTLGRKRVAVPPAPAGTGPHSPVRTLRKQRSTRHHMDDTVSLLESLPEDVLIKVLCKVNHSDLRQLLLVSKPVSQATIVAKELHFAFATPTAKVGFRDEECLEEGELQWAPRPRQRRVAGWSRLGGKDVAGIAVNLSVTFDRLLSEA